MQNRIQTAITDIGAGSDRIIHGSFDGKRLELEEIHVGEKELISSIAMFSAAERIARDQLLRYSDVFFRVIRLSHDPTGNL